MFSKIHLPNPILKRFPLSAALPYFALLLWLVPLLLFSSGHDSLMAHDEGLYALRARLMLDSGDWVSPWSTAHHKTPGPYWLIASSYTLFGISEASARLPSIITGIFSVLLVYEIGKILLSKKVAWLAAAILSVEFLWLQYSRLGTPDVPMVFLVLLAIWFLLKAELHPKYRFLFSFAAGLSFALGFLIRSFMIFLPVAALLPYLIWEHRRHRHLTNPMLYLGFVVGLIPSFAWLWFSWLQYGNLAIEELLRFVFRLGSNERHGNGVLFYLWNVPIKAFPWSFFSLLGLVLAIRRPTPRYQLLLVGCPLVLFAELSVFSTRLSHYSLILYPFIAMLAAVALDWLGKIYTIPPQSSPERKGRGNLTRNLSYAFGGLGALLFVASIVALIGAEAEIRTYAAITLVLGLGWLALPLIWLGYYRFNQRFLTARYWLAAWLIPAWLALAVAGFTGLIGDYNPDARAVFEQPAIASVLQSHPVHFVRVGGKTGVLLNFYTPHHGQRVQEASQLPPSSYAWISQEQLAKLPRPYRTLGSLQKWQLIQILP